MRLKKNFNFCAKNGLEQCVLPAYLEKVQNSENFSEILAYCVKNGWKQCVLPEYLKLEEVQKSELFSGILNFCAKNGWSEYTLEKNFRCSIACAPRRGG